MEVGERCAFLIASFAGKACANDTTAPRYKLIREEAPLYVENVRNWRHSTLEWPLLYLNVKTCCFEVS